MDDKDINSITYEMSNLFKRIIITKPEIERAANPERIRDNFIKNGEKTNILMTNSVQECTELIIEDEKPVLFAGSFYLIGEVLKYIGHQ